jgi:hypothetical protein
MNRRDLLLGLGLAAANMPRLLEALSAQSSATVLSTDTRRKIAVIADLMIPPTDTAGATAAGVVDFIDMMLASWFSPSERTQFLEGIATLDPLSWAQGGTGFLAANAAQQTQILTEMESRALQLDGTLDPKAFVSRIKLLVLTGFYTSEIGASAELDNTMIFRSFEGCIELAPGDRAQSTSTPVPSSL